MKPNSKDSTRKKKFNTKTNEANKMKLHEDRCHFIKKTNNTKT